MTKAERVTAILKFVASDRDRFITERTSIKEDATRFLAGMSKVPAKLLEGKITPLPSMDVNVLFKNFLSDNPDEEIVKQEMAIYHKYVQEVSDAQMEYIAKSENIIEQRKLKRAGNK